MTYTLVLLRHGESEWNAKNLFTGWVDVELSDKGRAEAVSGGELLKAADVLPDVVHTSLLRRAINTANAALNAADRHWIQVKRNWRLNERHYGDLQGKDKKQTKDQYGDEQFMLWRRSYDTPPPQIADDNPNSQAGDLRYADLGADMPKTECLKDVVARMIPYWESDIIPDLKDGKVVLVAAHGNSLRALVKHLDGISDEDIAGLNIPTGQPLVYRLDENFKPTVPGGEYLDPEAAKAAAEAVANQGK
ncbi:2,3-bisphosphoglycerate-dependent phosphoglycerate mutase [Kineosphaera limosa]|uniref:2,3-bisphosphoglycerate-dependent phosphoglycerate mutase n=1 Tax=Kineosphaera limosa NBRC 100340 TaxID=1184609 RepID=K6W9H9_9MICO|nr:phosphoglyceromutase [Kineosphaera limosa]NYD99740.1 2,3-bisphosphoglycerate-dependent phosphoglycerate mutase [Kineosphaera limosa]GAB95840.1 2,3-bisphosphoglycerate-dependent phosphoglycerate mutase [Kineosphaera limosa NBRC 100340]